MIELDSKVDKEGEEDNKEEDSKVDRDSKDNSTRREKLQKAKNIDRFQNTNRVRVIIGCEIERQISIEIRVVLQKQTYLAIQRELYKNTKIRQAVNEIYKE